MKPWIDAAAAAQSVEDANTEAKISMFDYHRGRIADPAFDAAALIFDQVLDQRVLFSVRDKAIKGDAKAQVLYYGKARLPAFVPGFPSWREANRRDTGDGEARTIDPRVAEAMVAAGIKAAEEAERVAEPSPRPRRRGTLPAPR
jgi:hypothetical protein